MLEPINDKNLADRAHEQIRAAIADGRYQPGARLVERRLAEELGVSHIPIREALARLADEGLVERLPRRGSRVAALTEKDIEEMSSVRIVLEQLVVERVQKRLTPADTAELRSLVAAMQKAARRGDVARVFELDQQFHEQLWRLSDHSLLNELASQMRARIASFLRAATASLDSNDLRQHAQSHVELLDAITSGRRARAQAAMATHIRTAAARLHRGLPPSAPGAALRDAS